jgi:hypothetical protein
MKYLKTYEAHSREPQIGDYVILFLEKDDQTPKFLKKTLEHKIGKIVNVNKIGDSFLISFGKIGKWYFNKENILDYSDKKENLRYFIDSEKYNL